MVKDSQAIKGIHVSREGARWTVDSRKNERSRAERGVIRTEGVRII